MKFYHTAIYVREDSFDAIKHLSEEIHLPTATIMGVAVDVLLQVASRDGPLGKLLVQRLKWERDRGRRSLV